MVASSNLHKSKSSALEVLIIFYIKESYPQAFPGVSRNPDGSRALRDATQVGKVLRGNMMEILKLRRDQSNFTKNSGIFMICSVKW